MSEDDTLRPLLRDARPGEVVAMVLEEFRRGAVRLHILHHAAEGEIYGAWMRDELAEHGHHISPGTLYPVLHAMREQGLLTSSEMLVAGRTRRLYRATEAGQVELEACQRALRELADEVLPSVPPPSTSR